MQKLVIGMQIHNSAPFYKVKGFTLLEILVVLIIIGITLGFALLAFGDFGEKRRIIVAAEQFTHYVKLAQQQAILEASTLGIHFNKQTYQILRFTSSGHWQPLPQKGIFHTQKIPSNTTFDWETEKKKGEFPEIIINASGDTTPFTLYFGSNKTSKLAAVIGKHDGSIILQTVNSP
ncbi:type II secretion system minor pseudopilin GspH [Legionella nagasakiensis]|uniref:type II secretion system minor pseudopilin GspH n=1 Tax=Legionella nagasakiensis TaxID=535290 RepID=UPI001055EEB0|nr:type II secretion system minor pseudopilin GspH [Legionella nagasakiensis]